MGMELGAKLRDPFIVHDESDAGATSNTRRFNPMDDYRPYARFVTPRKIESAKRVRRFAGTAA
jgi:hypothetical protein